ERHVLHARERSQASGEPVVPLEDAHRSIELLHRRRRTITRELEAWRRSVELAAPVLPLSRPRLARDQIRLPRGVVGERPLDRRQPRRGSSRDGGPRRAQLLEHNGEGRKIDDDVVRDQQQHVFTCAPEQTYPQQRSARQVEWTVTLPLEKIAQ